MPITRTHIHALYIIHIHVLVYLFAIAWQPFFFYEHNYCLLDECGWSSARLMMKNEVMGKLQIVCI